MRDVIRQFRQRLLHPKRWPPLLRTGRFWIVAGLTVTALILLHREFDLKTVHAHASRMNGPLAFSLLTILPLIGFPASVLHVVAGMRFGVPLGLALVNLSILLQMLASFALVRWQRKFFAARFKTVRERIPPGSHAAVTVFTMLIPGAPYCAQNYVLPLLGVPLRIYLGIGLPLHAARTIIAVVFGDQSDQLTVGRVLLMLVYTVLVGLASWWALRRLQAKLGDQPPAGNGRRQPA